MTGLAEASVTSTGAGGAVSNPRKAGAKERDSWPIFSPIALTDSKDRWATLSQTRSFGGAAAA